LYVIGGYIGFNEGRPFPEIRSVLLKVCALCGKRGGGAQKLFKVCVVFSVFFGGGFCLFGVIFCLFLGGGVCGWGGGNVIMGGDMGGRVVIMVAAVRIWPCLTPLTLTAGALPPSPVVFELQGRGKHQHVLLLNGMFHCWLADS
jgi:hypothetical protein